MPILPRCALEHLYLQADPRCFLLGGGQALRALMKTDGCIGGVEGKRGHAFRHRGGGSGVAAYREFWETAAFRLTECYARLHFLRIKVKLANLTLALLCGSSTLGLSSQKQNTIT